MDEHQQRTVKIQKTIMHFLVDAGHDVNGVMTLMQNFTVPELEADWKDILHRYANDPDLAHLFNVWGGHGTCYRVGDRHPNSDLEAA